MASLLTNRYSRVVNCYLTLLKFGSLSLKSFRLPLLPQDPCQAPLHQGIPVIAVSDVDAQKAVDEAPTDLAWILSDCEVDVHLRGVIIHSGSDRTRRFIGLGESRAEVKEALRNHLGLDHSEFLAMRVQVASTLSAWETSKDHVTKESYAKMEAKAAGCVRLVGQTEHQAMRKLTKPNGASFATISVLPGLTWVIRMMRLRKTSLRLRA